MKRSILIINEISISLWEKLRSKVISAKDASTNGFQEIRKNDREFARNAKARIGTNREKNNFDGGKELPKRF